MTLPRRRSTLRRARTAAAARSLLPKLTRGVQTAIEVLGSGFLRDPQNIDLLSALRSGALDMHGYYEQLVRLAYRLLFLLLAEDQNLLHPPCASEVARDRYRRGHSMDRLRTFASLPHRSHPADLWRSLVAVMTALGKGGSVDLGLPELGSFLWAPAATPALEACHLSSSDLLRAIDAIAFMPAGDRRRRVDYRQVSSTELSGIYEGLLELHPRTGGDPLRFTLSANGGSERKKSGSYYTPARLIAVLLDSALDPVLEEAAKHRDPESALLDLKIVDPACGSGYFLVAAARRLAGRLAAVRTQAGDPAPSAVRRALREVVTHCIYGVDLNDMAVEICKISLWLQALLPGMPLACFDRCIRSGNALFGATPALLAGGLPPAAFERIEGDDREFAGALKRLARRSRDHPLALPLQSSEHASLHADAWCAAFVWRKVPDAAQPPTGATLRRLAADPSTLAHDTRAEIERLAKSYRFFHWHLAFPDVLRIPAAGQAPCNTSAGWTGGFDVVLGNPPWDALSPDAKEFFSAYDPNIRFQDLPGQNRTIRTLISDSTVGGRWREHCRTLYGQVHFFKASGRYRLFAPGNLGKGDFNLYRLFVETALSIAKPGGWVAQIVPEGFYNGANAMAIRRHLLGECTLALLLGFENIRQTWFARIDSRTKFCLYAARKGGTTVDVHTAFRIHDETALAHALAGRSLRIPVSLVHELSPDILALVELRNQQDIDIAQKMYSSWPQCGPELVAARRPRYMREIDMGNDRKLFGQDPGGLPVYEGRMVDPFDHCAKGYRSGRGRAAQWQQLRFGDPSKTIQPQWYIHPDRIPRKARSRTCLHRIAYCNIVSPTNARTLMAALIPPGVICGHSLTTLVFDDPAAAMIWLSVANSFAMDFLARQKVALNMTHTIVDSLPFPDCAGSQPWARRLVELSLRLSCTGGEMVAYWNRLSSRGYVTPVDPAGPPPGICDDDLRLKARAEIDAIVARSVFHLTRAELAYVLDTFPVLLRKEQERLGNYRTKALVLEAYDACPYAGG